MSQKTIHEFAPAKINLFLHILGRRADGYHNLDSLVVFSALGDKLSVEKSPTYSLEITGPFATTLMADKSAPNLVLQAADVVSHCVKEIPPGADISLEKNIPIAAGLGGGSSDAAALVRALLNLHDQTLSETASQQIALAIGADVSVCLHAQASLMRGAGHSVKPLKGFAKTHAVLVNPRLQVSTAEVFSKLNLEKGERTQRSEVDMPEIFRSSDELCAFLADTQNDLEKPALSVAPIIGAVLDKINTQEQCQLARMSGSGASCFGIFSSAEAARNAADRLARDNPHWWVEETTLV